MGRAPCCDKANVKRGPWSPEEDETLKVYLQKHGTGGNWIALPHKAGLKRCGKSCRLRWLNYLRPDIKHGGFTEEEDNIICTLYRNIGSRWSVIASKLQGRTDNDVKNYWNTKLKKRVMGQIGQTNTTSYNTTGTYINPSPVPPQIPQEKVEPFGFGALPVTPESGFFDHRLADFAPNSNTYAFSPPPMRDVSAASSSLTVDNFGCMPWPDVTGVNGRDGHDGMMMDLSYAELLNWCNFHDKGGGEGASTSHSSNNISNHSTSSNVWTNAESKPSQELYQSLTYL